MCCRNELCSTRDAPPRPRLAPPRTTARGCWSSFSTTAHFPTAAWRAGLPGSARRAAGTAAAALGSVPLGAPQATFQGSATGAADRAARGTAVRAAGSSRAHFSFVLNGRFSAVRCTHTRGGYRVFVVHTFRIGVGLQVCIPGNRKHISLSLFYSSIHFPIMANQCIRLPSPDEDLEWLNNERQ